MSIGSRIKARRVQIGLTVDELAEKMGKDRATIYRYESDKIERMPADVLEPLAEALDTTPVHLMGWDHVQQKQNSPELTEREKTIVQLFGRLSVEQQALVISQIKGILANQ